MDLAMDIDYISVRMNGYVHLFPNCIDRKRVLFEFSDKESTILIIIKV